MNLSISFKKKIIEYILLNGCSLDNSGLMYGKAGMSLTLYEAARYFKDESIEAYAFDLFQEVLALNTKKYSFDSGKVGVAWALFYLINNQFIDADYQELYGEEHQSIIDHIVESKFSRGDIRRCIGYLVFLFDLKEQFTESDFEIMLKILHNALIDYFSQIPNTLVERECFCSNSSKLIGIYNLNEHARSHLSELVNLIVNVFNTLLDDCYVCNNLNFGTNLFICGVSNDNEDVVVLGNSTIDIVLMNTIKETLTMKQSLDYLYAMEQLILFGKDIQPFINVYRMINSLFVDENDQDTKLLFCNTNKQILSSLLGGIPRLLFIKSTNDTRVWKHDKKEIMLF